jgi:hypothetical protein
MVGEDKQACACRADAERMSLATHPLVVDATLTCTNFVTKTFFLAYQNIYVGCERKSGSNDSWGFRGGVVADGGNNGILMNSVIGQFRTESSDPLQHSFCN